MAELTMHVNWLAVGIGFVAAFALGWLWYSPRVFGARWAAGIGIKIDLDHPQAPPLTAMVLQALGSFSLAWVIGIMAAAGALFTALLIVLMLMLLVAAGGLYAQKSTAAIVIETGYIAAMALLMMIVQRIF